MNPMIIIGCGGSGGATVVGLRRVLEMRLRQMGWEGGLPKAWQMIWVDTLGVPDSSVLEFGDPIPPDDYVCITAKSTSYTDVHEKLFRSIEGKPEKARHFQGWVPEPASVKMSLIRGAGQMRAVGRMAQVDRMRDLADRLNLAVTEISNALPELKLLDQHVNGGVGEASNTPFVVVISSLAGGTGAGVFLDVCDLARVIDNSLENNVISILYTPEIFKGKGTPTGLEYNALAAISELMNGYFKPVNTTALDLYGGIVEIAAGESRSSGPNYPFIVGLKNLHGVELTSSSQAYRCVTETLASVLLDRKVAEDFNTRISGNWISEQATRETVWAHHNYTHGKSEVPLNGVVSSFGSARLSLGLELFGEYSAHRLAREAVEFLADGYLRRGRIELNDRNASAEEILQHYESRYAGKFLADCGFGEKDGFFFSQDDAIEVLRSQAAREITREEWSTRIELKDLRGILADAINAGPRERFQRELEKTIFEKRAAFLATTPETILDAVSKCTLRYGIQTSRRFVQLLNNQVEAFIARLGNNAKDALSFRDHDAFSAAVKNFKSRDRLSNENPSFEDIYKAAFSPILWTSWAEANREHVQNTYRELVDKFVAPLLTQLQQLELQAEYEKPKVSNWPKDVAPDEFLPSPLEFCLIDPSDWPSIYDELLSRSCAKDVEALVQSPTDFGRISLGSGAIAIEGSWSGGVPARFKSQLGSASLLGKARAWIRHRGTPFGDYLSNSLASYLADRDEADFAITDVQTRRDQFRINLSRAISGALPLAHILPSTFDRIHPSNEGADGVKGADGEIPLNLIAEALPFAPDEDPNSPYQIAFRILQASPGVVPEDIKNRFFDTDRQNAEGVLFVYRLNGAVHPSSIASLSAPIAQAWRSTALQSTVKNRPWTNRRTRRLVDFVGARPSAIHNMTMGWITGRKLGLIQVNELKGVSIDRIDDSRAYGKTLNGLYERGELPWPLLSGSRLVDDIQKGRLGPVGYLGAVLESLGLAQMLFATEPKIMDGYEMLWHLGDQHRDLLELVSLGYDFENPALLGGNPIEILENIGNDWTELESAYERSLQELQAFVSGRSRYVAMRKNEKAWKGDLPLDAFQAELSELLVPAYAQLNESVKEVLAEAQAFRSEPSSRLSELSRSE